MDSAVVSLTHRGRRSQYSIERRIVLRKAYFDRKNGEIITTEAVGMAFFTEGEVLHTPKYDGSLDR